MANHVAGIAGVSVIVAGWTTANPTIYRAGMAFQAILPNLSRFKITFMAGMVATFAGLFPAFAWKLLGFVGLYGTILAPMGAVIFFDWYCIRRQQRKHLDVHAYTGNINITVLRGYYPLPLRSTVSNLKACLPHFYLYLAGSMRSVILVF